MSKILEDSLRTHQEEQQKRKASKESSEEPIVGEKIAVSMNGSNPEVVAAAVTGNDEDYLLECMQKVELSGSDSKEKEVSK